MINYKIFVINLKRDESKKELFIDNNEDILLDFEVVEAVDGAELDLSDAGYNKDKAYKCLGREMTHGEVGCYLSHMYIYQRVVDEGLSHALIFEDDVKIIDNNILCLMNEMFSKRYWDLLFLYKRGRNRFLLDGIPLGHIGKYKYHIGTRTVWGTPAYIVTNKAAKKLLKYSRDIYVPIDMLGRTWRDRFLNMYYITPDFIDEDKSMSVLEAERSELVKNARKK